MQPIKSHRTSRVRRYGRIAALTAAAIIAAAGSLYAVGGRGAKVAQRLAATSAAPTAHGKAKLVVHSSKHGKFAIVASRLAPSKTYDVIVGGVKVGAINTTAGGSGRALFKTQPRSKDALLGFDPRGAQVLVRDAEDGEDVLAGDLPSDDAGNVACCLTDNEGETECEDLSAADCTAAGGMPIGEPGGTAAASCLPDPCNGAPPPEHQIVCCTNATHDDESEAECEEVSTEAACAAAGGMVVQAASCDAHPCQVTPPANVVACCVAEDGGSDSECKAISSEACTAIGGTVSTAASCHPDPCGGSSGGDDGGGGQDDDGQSGGGDN